MPRRTVVALNEGGRRIGEGHPRAKLSQRDVNRMLDMRATGWSLGQLAKVFGVSKGAVQHICSGRHWTHKACAYVIAAGVVDSAGLVLNLEGVAPTLGPSNAAVDELTDSDWPVSLPDPVPALPPLIAAVEPGQRAVEQITWFLARAVPVAAAAPCADLESAPPVLRPWER